RVCLCVLYYEQGLAEDQLAGGAAQRGMTMGGIGSSTVITSAGLLAGDSARSFQAAADLAAESGAPRVAGKARAALERGGRAGGSAKGSGSSSSTPSSGS
ncbi:hypothetical protein TeGR_g13749, partial [Tetraparma gracilis]